MNAEAVITPLETIMSSNDGYSEDYVVRWCPECGAIVVDAEFEGRTSPGQIMDMKLPNYVKETVR